MRPQKFENYRDEQSGQLENEQRFQKVCAISRTNSLQAEKDVFSPLRIASENLKVILQSDITLKNLGSAQGVDFMILLSVWMSHPNLIGLEQYFRRDCFACIDQLYFDCFFQSSMRVAINSSWPVWRLECGKGGLSFISTPPFPPL